VTLGDHVKIHSNVNIGKNCKIGKNTVIYPGVGNVIIEDHVSVGANTVIDCATFDSTIIEKGVKLDNLIQVAHNVEIGEDTVIAAQVGISGSSKIGKHCMIGGQAGINGHLQIADHSRIAGKPLVDADVDNVVDLSRGTSLEHNGARINTVEHTLAALVALEIDNVLIQLDGPEPPVLDGSARPFMDAILEVGIKELNAQRNFFEIPESVFYEDKSRDVEIAALPLDDFRVTVMVDYNSPVLGSQHASLNNIEDFYDDISNARTFCFLHEVEELYKQNLIKGGDISNAIVVVDRVIENGELDYLAELLDKPKIEVKKEGILDNVELHHKNEPVDQ
ncbi:lpxC/fabZ, partial [Symbiodinium microadriaticum]